MQRIWDLVDSIEGLVHKTLSSRKASAAVTGVVAGLTTHNVNLVLGSIAAYVLGEAYIDAKNG